MAVEIERKFLVKKSTWDALPKPSGHYYQQAYLLNTPEKTIRVRQTDTQGFITIKGATQGIRRSEYEFEIPWTEAGQILDEFCSEKIEKMRYKIPFGGHIFEVDEFMGRHAGVVVAEVELIDESTEFEKPAWLGREVSDYVRYFNAVMIRSDWVMPSDVE
ncbi:MAG: CYTH domain-containing protein [Chitinophagaceae bacterium]|nr:CYTH domain-containing protein [Chitinophagaceae bacterium]